MIDRLSWFIGEVFKINTSRLEYKVAKDYISVMYGVYYLDSDAGLEKRLGDLDKEYALAFHQKNYFLRKSLLSVIRLYKTRMLNEKNKRRQAAEELALREQLVEELHSNVKI